MIVQTFSFKSVSLTLIALATSFFIVGCSDKCDGVEAVEVSELADTSLTQQHGWNDELPTSVESLKDFMMVNGYTASQFGESSSAPMLFPVNLDTEKRKEIIGGIQFSRPAEKLKIKGVCQPFMRSYRAYIGESGLVIYIDDAYSYSGP